MRTERDRLRHQQEKSSLRPQLLQRNSRLEIHGEIQWTVVDRLEALRRLWQMQCVVSLSHCRNDLTHDSEVELQETQCALPEH